MDYELGPDWRLAEVSPRYPRLSTDRDPATRHNLGWVTPRARDVKRIRVHVELALSEVLQRTDNEIGRTHEDTEKGVPGTKGRLAQAEARHAEVTAPRHRRRGELEKQAAITLQGVERLASALILPRARERDCPHHALRRVRPLPNENRSATAH